MALDRPSHLNRENADAFADAEVARLYRHRPPYPKSAIVILSELVRGEPRVVLDLGCGTGFVARPLARLVDRVDAVDPSSAMLDVAREESGGGDARIRWIEGRAEEVALDGGYGLIVAGESLHWMDWPTVFARAAVLLREDALFAVTGVDAAPLPWDDELRAIIAAHSVVRDYRPFDLLATLRERGLFEVHGVRTAPAEPFEQSVADYIASFHARSSLTRERMGRVAADAFDREVAALLARHGATSVTRIISATVTYGRP